MINIVIADDHPIVLAGLGQLIRGEAGMQVVATCVNGSEALQAVHVRRPDVLLLDINMPKLDGFDVLDLIGDEIPVIFTTAYDQYALRAFDVHAVDYLLKPFDAERLAAAVTRARERLARKARDDREDLAAVLEEIRAQRDLLARAAAAGGWAERLMVRRGSDLVPLSVESIDWIASADNYVEIHAGRETHLLRETMQSVESHLDPRAFARIHRGTIVNRARVRAVRTQATGELAIELVSGALLPVGRSYRARVSARWQTSRPEAESSS